MSGGRATMGGKVGKLRKAQAGDVCAIDPLGHRLTDWYMVECKHLDDLALTGWVTRQAGECYHIWHKLIEQSFTHGKMPLLIARQNNYPVLCMTTLDGLPGLAARGTATLVHDKAGDGRHAIAFSFEQMLAEPCPLLEPPYCPPSSPLTSTSLITPATPTDGASSPG